MKARTSHKTLIAAAICAVSFASMQAQAQSNQSLALRMGDRVVCAAGRYFVNQGSAALQQIRKQIEGGIHPDVEHLPTVVVTPSAAELREAGLDPDHPRNHLATR
ncbi:MAG: hypothetical protein ACRESS_02040 [Stenotrophobium sp.]